jgi:hypothetical protein
MAQGAHAFDECQIRLHRLAFLGNQVVGPTVATKQEPPKRPGKANLGSKKPNT